MTRTQKDLAQELIARMGAAHRSSLSRLGAMSRAVPGTETHKRAQRSYDKHCDKYASYAAELHELIEGM
jgi:hypothetical protein